VAGVGLDVSEYLAGEGLDVPVMTHPPAEPDCCLQDPP
jgi:hypothetical protein